MFLNLWAEDSINKRHLLIYQKFSVVVEYSYVQSIYYDKISKYGLKVVFTVIGTTYFASLKYVKQTE